jgi:hypothetical protein
MIISNTVKKRLQKKRYNKPPLLLKQRNLSTA